MKSAQQSLEITAGMMVETINRQGGKPITVSVGRYATAFTDGNNIAIPEFPSDRRFIGLAYLGHEASHCRVTDMSKFAAFARKGPVHKAMLNILEDIRIERSITRLYPGLTAQLKKLVAYLVETKKMKAPTMRDHPIEIFIGWLLCSRRAWVLKQDALDGPAEKADKVVRRVFGSDFIDTVEQELGCLKTMDIGPKGMDESISLADTIMRLLKQKAEDESESQDQDEDGQDGQGQGNEDSSGDQGDQSDQDSQGEDQGDSSSGDQDGEDSSGGSGGSEDESEDESDDGGQGGSQSGEESGESDESGSQAQGNQGDQGDQSDSGDEQGDSEGDDGATQESLSDLADPVDDSSSEEGGKSNPNGRGGDSALPSDWKDHQPKRKVDLGELTEELSRRDSLRNRDSQEPSLPPRRLSTEEQRQQPCLDHYMERAVGDNLVMLKETKARVETTSRQLAGPVRRELRSILEGADRVRHDPRRSGRLNRRALPGVMTGERRVFQRKIEGKAQTAAVHVMLDASGSMGRVMPDALIAVHSILEALEPLRKVNSGFSVFPMEVRRFDDDGAFRGYDEKGTSLVKAHGESLANAKKKSDYFAMSRGGTPMVASMRGIAPMLLAQPEERKILIVVTDGTPNEGHRQARAKIAEYRRAGVDVFGVGLGAPATTASFGEDHTVLIDDVLELPKALKKVVRAAIS